MTGVVVTVCSTRAPLGGRFYLLCACAFAFDSCFYLPLSAAPLHAAGRGGDVEAGLVTGVLMAGTILGELLATRLIAFAGRRVAAAVAILALALPSLAAFSADLVVSTTANFVRGLGL